MLCSPRIVIASLACVLTLAGCSDSNKSPDNEDTAQADPALEGALGEQIMVDPDLAASNEAGAGGAVGGASGALPPQDNSPKAIADARAEALKLLGGVANLQKAPAPRNVASPAASGALITAAARAAATSSDGAKCAEQVDYTMSWAAKLPQAFPVYPRGNVQEAAGTDAKGCGLRVVSFSTPVAMRDVMDFYHSRAIQAGYKADYVRQGGDDVLGGTKGQASYVIYARKLPSGRTEVDLVTNGG